MDERLKSELRSMCVRMLAMLDGVDGAPSQRASVGAVADDRDLDSQYGDPEVRFDPKRWDGPSYVGKRYSECPSDYLDTLAGFLDWSAGKDESSGDEKKVKNASYRRRDAARARGWSRRNAGQRAEPPPSREPFSAGASDDSDIPF